LYFLQWILPFGTAAKPDPTLLEPFRAPATSLKHNLGTLHLEGARNGFESINGVHVMDPKD
jgi:hypothetical protein